MEKIILNAENKKKFWSYTCQEFNIEIGFLFDLPSKNFQNIHDFRRRHRFWIRKRNIENNIFQNKCLDANEFRWFIAGRFNMSEEGARSVLDQVLFVSAGEPQVYRRVYNSFILQEANLPQDMTWTRIIGRILTKILKGVPWQDGLYSSKHICKHIYDLTYLPPILELFHDQNEINDHKLSI